MSESEQNVPKGIRANYPKRPAIDEDAWAKIRASQERMKDREFVRFSIFKVDPAWRQLASVERDQHKDEFEALIASSNAFSDLSQILSSPTRKSGLSEYFKITFSKPKSL